jgi:exopolyphosphatase
VKEEFLAALRDNTADDYIIVIGNEAGDLDSMVSALSYSWFLSEVEGKKAVAVLQTPESALHLRKENVDALMFSNMTSGHRDILSESVFVCPPTEVEVLIIVVVFISD